MTYVRYYIVVSYTKVEDIHEDGVCAARGFSKASRQCSEAPLRQLAQAGERRYAEEEARGKEICAEKSRSRKGRVVIVTSS